MILAIAAVSLALAAPPADDSTPVDLSEMTRALMEKLEESLQKKWAFEPGREIILGPRFEPPAIDPSKYEILLEDWLSRRHQIGESAQPESPPGPPERAVWTMYWDDTVDGSVPGRDSGGHSCQIGLHMLNGTIAGTFVGPVLGEVREACFTGTSFQSQSGAVFNFQQDEPGYRCVYAGRLTNKGHIAGTWYDTRGGSGDFVMWHDANRPKSGVNGKIEVIDLEIGTDSGKPRGESSSPLG